MKKLDRKSASSPPFKNTCLCNILPAPFCEMYTCYWIYLVWNNKYIWQWKVVLNFRFTKLLHNLKTLDSRHLWNQVNMSVKISPPRQEIPITKYNAVSYSETEKLSFLLLLKTISICQAVTNRIRAYVKLYKLLYLIALTSIFTNKTFQFPEY